MRHRLSTMILAPAIVLAAACSKDKPATDASLNNDLTLAAQARQNATLDSITPADPRKHGTPRPQAAHGTKTPGTPGPATPARKHPPPGADGAKAHAAPQG